MPEPLSIAIAGYPLALAITRASSAVSPEADAVHEAASAIIASRERSLALFGAKRAVIESINELARACAADGWDGEGGVALSPDVVQRAVSFIRAIPDAVRLPEVSAEPDGAISFDWIVTRTRVFSASIGATNRLAYAWIDGTDRGHGVARFNGDTVPPAILAAIGAILNERTTHRVA